MASLKLSHIYKVYDNGHKAVNDFSIDIEDKEFIVFVGPSGCGKSTTLRMIAGLEKITAGDLFIGDTLVNDVMPKDRDIAMVFQNYALYPHMSVYENMAFGLRNRHIPEEEIKSSGYIVDTLEAALWCFLNTDNYRGCVLKAVNLGADTDTVACVAGSIAGLYYGDIPKEWIKDIRNKQLIDDVITRFTKAIIPVNHQ